MTFFLSPSDTPHPPTPFPVPDFENISLELGRGNSPAGKLQEWWIVNQTQPGKIKRKSMDHGKVGLDLYIFSDQVSPPSLGFLAGYG